MKDFLIVLGSIVGAIVGLKVFFTLWKVLEKRLHPEQFLKPRSAPETAFKGLKGRKVIVRTKTGEVIKECQYKATLYFNDGEFTVCPTVYFELEKADGNRLFISGADILSIETTDNP